MFSCACTFAVVKYSKISSDFSRFICWNWPQFPTKWHRWCDCTNNPVNTTHKFINRRNIGENYLCNFIQLRRNNLLKKINFTTQKHSWLTLLRTWETLQFNLLYENISNYLHTFHKTIFKRSIGKILLALIKKTNKQTQWRRVFTKLH